MKKLVQILITFLAASNLYAQAEDSHSGVTQQNNPTVWTTSESRQEFNCFAVIAGKAATADGSVLLAHNEDDSGEQMLNIYVVPRREYASSGTTAADAKYLWCEFPGMEVADAFLNEYGVGIVSNSCPSKEDRKDFTDGGVLYEVRTTVAKSARSSREAVKMLGKLVEERGYRGSGRTYSIADPDEAWIFSVVQGRHWVAQRVPDDCVMALPNNYIIDEIDLSDTLNFAGSPDIIAYAVERGWYNPQKDGTFSFKKAYCKPSTYISDRNVLRHQSALQYLTGKNYNSNPNSFELFTKPNRKITIGDMIEILASHGENLPEQTTTMEERMQNRHPQRICVDRTDVSTIFQLNRNTPKELGHIMWVAPGRPCVEPFTPWYTAMEKAPEGWGRFETAKEAQEKHFSDAKGMREKYPQAKVWEVTERWEWLNEDYNTRKDALEKRRDKEQKRIFKEHMKRMKSKK